jgi:aminopeptidase N
MVIGAGEFTVSHHRPVINGRDTIPMEVWTYPEDSAYADSIPFKNATAIVETLQRIIGPFPYEKLAHVQSSTRYGGMENASAIFYAEQPYVDRRMGEGVVRHETAHQWFGDAVTERDWHHLWLSEGFASYFDLVAGAALHGDSVLTAGIRSDAESYMRSGVVDRPIIDTSEHDLMKLLNANNYQKGAWVLHMLRGLVSDSAFFRGIREYYRRYRDSTALSEDLQAIMEDAANRPLDWFFQQWLRQPGYPRFAVSWRPDTGARQVRVDFLQAQPDTWGTFRLPRVTVELRDAGGAVVRRTVSVEGRRSVALLDVPAAFTAAEVRIDPDGKLLLRQSVTRNDTTTRSN